MGIKFKISDEQTVWPARLHEVKIHGIRTTAGYTTLMTYYRIEGQILKDELENI